ncbi:response regulator [Candidatus Desantisbacteria bacterium]|nr:response regulator [Candidatus Desantisbacteria bacterium]
MQEENNLSTYMKDISVLVNQSALNGGHDPLLKNKIRENCSFVATIIDKNDAYQEGHAQRKAGYAESLASRLGLNEVQQETVSLAALLHDIGKLWLDAELLLKTGNLSSEELKIIRKHTFLSERILMSVGFPWDLLCAVRSHHECPKGNGYPDGLQDNEIPVEASIVKIIDAYGAMTDNRPYRNILPVTEAINELEKGKGTEFDGDITNVFIKMLQERGSIGMDEINKSFPIAPRKKILVVDDDPSICAIIGIKLEHENFEVITASHGSEALRKAYYILPDLIILDIMLPDMNGYEICKRLSMDPRTSGVPILVLTVRDSSEEVIAFENGAVDFINKPFELYSLVAHINAHLKRFDRTMLLNPLTGLRGRTIIDTEIKKRLANKERPFALMCIDVNGLKAFNDFYGFLQGDNVIKLVAEILSTSVRTGFIGHNGGDDFVVLIEPERVDVVCQKIISLFDEKIQGLYHPVDYGRGQDRDRRLNDTPILTLSIGVAVNGEKQSFKRSLDIFDAASEMMEYCKSLQGSAYRISEK